MLYQLRILRIFYSWRIGSKTFFEFLMRKRARGPKLLKRQGLQEKSKLEAKKSELKIKSQSGLRRKKWNLPDKIKNNQHIKWIMQDKKHELPLELAEDHYFASKYETWIISQLRKIHCKLFRHKSILGIANIQTHAPYFNHMTIKGNK